MDNQIANLKPETSLPIDIYLDRELTEREDKEKFHGEFLGLPNDTVIRIEVSDGFNPPKEWVVKKTQFTNLVTNQTEGHIAWNTPGIFNWNDEATKKLITENISFKFLGIIPEERVVA